MEFLFDLERAVEAIEKRVPFGYYAVRILLSLAVLYSVLVLVQLLALEYVWPATKAGTAIATQGLSFPLSISSLITALLPWGMATSILGLALIGVRRLQSKLYLQLTILQTGITTYQSVQQQLADLTQAPYFVFTVDRIEIAAHPDGCQLTVHARIRNRGSDSRATDWQLRAANGRGLSLVANEPVAVAFEPEGGDLIDHPVRRDDRRPGTIVFIVQGATEAQARQVTYCFLHCQDGRGFGQQSTIQRLTYDERLGCLVATNRAEVANG